MKTTKNPGNLTVRRPYDLQVNMDRMFNDFRTKFENLFWPISQKDLLNDIQTRSPSMDIADLGDKYEMHFEIPGIPKEDIDIEVTNNSIEIHADHEENKEDKNKNWLRKERTSMSFFRYLDIPEQIKSDNVDAEFKDGILTLILPKVKPKPKQKSSKVKIK